jgi:hypothetical protein
LIHRRTAIICAALALALTAPGAAAAAQDLRSPDARDAAQLQDLRSPDARDAAQLQDLRSPVAAPQPPVAEPVGRDGIAPLPFVLALVGALVAGIALTSAAHTVRGRRRVAHPA